MKHSVMLTITSLLSILFFTFHLAGDIVRGFEKGGVYNLTAVPIFVVWLYGTLVLTEPLQVNAFPKLRQQRHLWRRVAPEHALVQPCIAARA
jgi:hypothetical protein